MANQSAATSASRRMCFSISPVSGRGRDISASQGTAEPPPDQRPLHNPGPERWTRRRCPFCPVMDRDRETVVPVHTAGKWDFGCLDFPGPTQFGLTDIYQLFLENSDLCCSYYMKTDFHPSRWVRTQTWGCSVNRASGSWSQGPLGVLLQRTRP